MKTYTVTNIYRCEIVHVIQAENEVEAQDIAAVRESGFTDREILADGLHSCDTTVEELT